MLEAESADLHRQIEILGSTSQTTQSTGIDETSKASCDLPGGRDSQHEDTSPACTLDELLSENSDLNHDLVEALQRNGQNETSFRIKIDEA